MTYIYNSNGNSCKKDVWLWDYKVCLDSDWKAALGISSYPIYSNVGENFFAWHYPSPSRPITIYIKESWPYYSERKELYFYTDSAFTQKAPRGYYNINASSAQFMSHHPRLYASGIKWVFVNDRGKVEKWVGEKGMSVVDKLYSF